MPSSTSFFVSTHVSEDHIRVVAGGEIDASTADPFETALVSAEEEWPDAALVVDLREVTFMASSGLHVLMRARSRAMDQERRLTLAVGPRLRRILDVANLSGLFEYRD